MLSYCKKQEKGIKNEENRNQILSQLSQTSKFIQKHKQIVWKQRQLSQKHKRIDSSQSQLKKDQWSLTNEQIVPVSHDFKVNWHIGYVEAEPLRDFFGYTNWKN